MTAHGDVDANGDIVAEAAQEVLALRARLEAAICIEDEAQRDAHLEAIAAELDRVHRARRGLAA